MEQNPGILSFPAWPCLPAEAVTAVQQALGNSQYDKTVLNGLMGNEAIGLFEQEFARKVHAAYALAVNSGASALHLALIAAGIGPGDEVIIPAYGWGQILVFLDALDAVPVFADIDPNTLGLCPDSVAGRITERTRAVVVTHLAGCPADIESLAPICRAANALLIEDCAQALGARLGERPAGTLGDIAIFSLGPRKHLPCGEGGLLVTNHRLLYERTVVAGQHPDRASLEVTDPRLVASLSESFWPYRVHPLAAIIGSALLPFLDNWHRERSENHRHLCCLLADSAHITIPQACSPEEHAWGGLMLTYREQIASSRDKYIHEAQRQGVPISAGPVRVPLHLRRETRARWGVQLPCPVAEKRCTHEELFIQESIALVGNQSQLIALLADILR